MTTTTTTIRRMLRDDPYCSRLIARAHTWRLASQWGTSDTIHPYTRDSFRSMMRTNAKRAINEARILAGGAK